MKKINFLTLVLVTLSVLSSCGASVSKVNMPKLGNMKESININGMVITNNTKTKELFEMNFEYASQSREYTVKFSDSTNWINASANGIDFSNGKWNDDGTKIEEYSYSLVKTQEFLGRSATSVRFTQRIIDFKNYYTKYIYQGHKILIGGLLVGAGLGENGTMYHSDIVPIYPENDDGFYEKANQFINQIGKQYVGKEEVETLYHEIYENYLVLTLKNTCGIIFQKNIDDKPTEKFYLTQTMYVNAETGKIDYMYTEGYSRMIRGAEVMSKFETFVHYVDVSCEEIEGYIKQDVNIIKLVSTK